MKLFFTASVFVFFSLKMSAQCPIFWADSEAILSDSEAAWVFDETSDCIEKEVKLPLSIFPNPTSDYFEVKNAVNTEGVLFDLQGRFVRRFLLNDKTICDISDLPSALYIICVDNQIFKIIKIN
jgi:hypothetical protein